MQQSREYLTQFYPEIYKVIKYLNEEVMQVENENHPEYLKVLETLEATRLRLLGVAEIYYYLAIYYAKHTLDYMKKQIDNDYYVGKDDAKEMVNAELRKKKRELRDLLDKLQSQQMQCNSEIKQCNDITIPYRKKDRKAFPQYQFNFKLNEHESRQDLYIINALNDEIEALKK